MLQSILRFSVDHRWFVMLLTFFAALLGVFNFERLPIDAVPDITNVQVQVNTEAPGYTPLEVEQRITFPVETAISGVPSLEYTRSLSRYGLSQVTAVFKDGTDIYHARQLLSERLQQVRENLPENISPAMGPIATGLGEIYMYTVKNAPGSSTYSPRELRTVQDWIIKPQLRNVEGVIEVNTSGGFVQQYHVTPHTQKLFAFSLTFHDVIEALLSNNDNVGAGYIERKGQQVLIRSPGQVKSIEEINRIPVATHSGIPVLIGDVADVSVGHELPDGASTEDGQDVVLGTVFMLMGENSRTVSGAVASKMQDIQRSLPEGVLAETVYDRTKLVKATINTVRNNLVEGALLVILVLFVLLGNFRAALITAAVIPLSMLFTITGMVHSDLTANLMSLGALDFGLIVDGSVIIVENCIRRLSEEQKNRDTPLSLSERIDIVYDASREVRRATMFGELIIIIVYLPILALGGIEGKMFHPMALTVIMALTGAMVLSLTFVPAAVAIFVSEKTAEKESFFFRISTNSYKPLLNFAILRPGTVIIAAFIPVIISFFLLTRTGTEFIPRLDEGDIALHALRVPGTSLSQAVKMQKVIERKLRDIPEIENAFSKIGTPDIATDPMPPAVADGFVILKPRHLWPDPSRSKAQVIQEIEDLLETLPGNVYEFTQPIEMRFNELIAGVRSDLAIKLFGDDLEELKETADRLVQAVEKVQGAEDVRAEAITGLPILSVQLRQDRLYRYGLSRSYVQDVLQIATGGRTAGSIFEGDRKFDIVVRLPETSRVDIDALKKVLIPLPESSAHEPGFHPEVKGRPYVPFIEVADFVMVPGPNQISRENGKRKIVVTANVRNRDLGSFVEDAMQKVANEVTIPAGYWITWGGQFENLISARKRLQIVVPMALLLVFLLLFTSLGSLKDTLIVFSGVPFALTGGIIAILIRGIPFSISAAVGFIALSGVAVLNGLVIITFINARYQETGDLRNAVFSGSLVRLRPVLMTALVASLGFVPMAFATGTGAEVQRPLATVVIGGIISSTILTLLVLPALYIKSHEKGRDF